MTKDYVQIGIVLTIKDLEKDINDLEVQIRAKRDEIALVQGDCSHPNAKGSHHTDRNYDEPGQVVSAWTAYICPDCGKTWSGSKKEID